MELQISRNFDNSFLIQICCFSIKNFGTNNQSKMKRLTTENYIPDPTKRNLQVIPFLKTTRPKDAKFGILRSEKKIEKPLLLTLKLFKETDQAQ